MSSDTIHQNHLLDALKEARQAEGQTYPNPPVGCVVVKDNRIIGRGFHARAGLAHAEPDALSKCNAQGATLYVTLEPCCHWGKTPPCTEAIIKSGVKHVVFATSDPNPLVSGNGAESLRKAGIEVTQISATDIDDLYRPYVHWRRTGMPYTVAKLAMSLDGKIAGPGGVPVDISGPALAGVTHYYRSKAAAIFTSAETIVADNPRLNARLADQAVARPIYVFDPRGRVSPEANIFKNAAPITLFRKNPGPLPNAQVIELKKSTFAEQLVEVFRRIGEEGNYSVWAETGGRLHEALVEQRLVQKSYLYVCPKWLGNEALTAFSLDFGRLLSQAVPRWQVVGQDAWLELDW